ncbi:MAG: YcaO-like family protein [Sphingomonas sp.]
MIARLFPGAAGLPAPVAKAALAVGVSRLGDVTGLDVLGVPVWQAVRPWSRSISVHQGKALNGADARIGAAMEAVETGLAEAVQPDHRALRWTDLPVACRPAQLDDFARRRGAAMDDISLDWIAATDIVDGCDCLVPFAAVSLDFDLPSQPFVRCESNGHGAHLTLAAASLKGLLELIERDALAEPPGIDPSAWRLAEHHVAHGIWPWFDSFRDRTAAAGIGTTVFSRTGLAGVPVVQCELRSLFAGCPVGTALGSAAGVSVEAALRGAVTEAAQVRLTLIANAREDIILAGVSTGATFVPPAFGFFQPATLNPRVALPETAEAALAELIARLTKAGFGRILRIMLSPPDFPVVVVRMIVPGLASGERARRQP